MGKPQLRKPGWLLEPWALAQGHCVGRARPESAPVPCQLQQNFQQEFYDLLSSKQSLGRGLMTSNDSVSAAVAKSSVVLPQAATA